MNESTDQFDLKVGNNRMGQAEKFKLFLENSLCGIAAVTMTLVKEEKLGEIKLFFKQSIC